MWFSEIVLEELNKPVVNNAANPNKLATILLPTAATIDNKAEKAMGERKGSGGIDAEENMGTFWQKYC